MAGHMPMRHIDRKELYTDVESRIRYLHSFLDFSSDDIDALIYASKYVKVLIPAVVNIVYKKLLQYDITARAFTTRSTSFEGPMDEIPTIDSPQLVHRKMFLRAYLNKLCSDPSRLDYWEYCDKVGMMHVGLGREHPLHIEFIHLNATLALVQEVMTEAILSHPRLSLTRKISIVKALGKVIWIQNDLMAKWHVRDGEEFSEIAMFNRPAVEEEGYLNGQKILDDFSDEDTVVGGPGGTPASPSSKIPRRPGSGSGSAPLGVCPFSGISRDMQAMKVSGDAAPAAACPAGASTSAAPSSSNGVPQSPPAVKQEPAAKKDEVPVKAEVQVA